MSGAPRTRARARRASPERTSRGTRAGSTFVLAQRGELDAREPNAGARLERRAERQQVSGRRRQLAGEEKRVRAACPRDRDESSDGSPMIRHFDRVATFDLPQVAACLLSELANADRLHVLFIAHAG